MFVCALTWGVERGAVIISEKASVNQFQFPIETCRIVFVNISLKPNSLSVLYSHLQHHNDTTIIKTDAHRKTHEDFFNNILPLNLLQGFERFVQGFACERVLETKHKLHILTSTTYDSHVVSFLFSWCSTRGLGVHCWMLAFFTASYQHLLWTPNSIGGFRGPPRSAVAFPTTSGL